MSSRIRCTIEKPPPNEWRREGKIYPRFTQRAGVSGRGMHFAGDVPKCSLEERGEWLPPHQQLDSVSERGEWLPPHQQPDSVSEHEYDSDELDAIERQQHMLAGGSPAHRMALRQSGAPTRDDSTMTHEMSKGSFWTPPKPSVQASFAAVCFLSPLALNAPNDDSPTTLSNTYYITR
jgi:hypothetical protein